MPAARIRAVGLAVVSTIMATFGVAGRSRLSGPVILSLSGSHGVHLDDLLVAACWFLAMAWCWRLWRER